ncbi:MAG: hypothetical protein GF401_01485 [Chitinivibrionales bacterium]|nr:hypothetical protein [Chitinivibrionales bacterium]
MRLLKAVFAKLLDCFFLLRIPLLAPVWTILILGWITGNEHAHLGGIFSGNGSLLYSEARLWLALFGFSLVVAWIYVVNQIADIESDRINKKLFILPYGLVSVRTAWVLAAVCALTGLFVSFYFDLIMFLLFAAGLVLGYLYDLPPASLKNRAWGGTIACFLGHGVLTYLVGWYAAQYDQNLVVKIPSIPPINSNLWIQGLLASFSAGFANAAIFVTTTIPDASGDKATGKKTFCVAYGEKKTAIAATVFCALALVFCFFLQYNPWVMIVPAVVSLVLFIYLIVSTNRSMAFKAFKWPVFLLSAFVVFYIPLYGALIVVTFFGSKLYYHLRMGINYPTFKAQ